MKNTENQDLNIININNNDEKCIIIKSASDNDDDNYTTSIYAIDQFINELLLNNKDHDLVQEIASYLLNKSYQLRRLDI